MRLCPSTRAIVFGFILALGITLTLPYFALAATRSFGGSGRSRAPGIHGQPFFHALSTVLDFLVWVESSTSSQSSLFSSLGLQQLPNPENLPETEFTFSHAGWTAGMAWRSYSQDTGPTQDRVDLLPPLPSTARPSVTFCFKPDRASASHTFRIG
jgi:hypothetical protein